LLYHLQTSLRFLTPKKLPSVYKKPRIHRKISNPNGPHPLGFSFYTLQMLLDPVFGRYPILLLKGCEEDGFALEPGALRDALVRLWRTSSNHFRN
jgi:hypothetical protein